MGCEIRPHRCHGNVAVEIDAGIGVRSGGDLLVAAAYKQELAPGWRQGGFGVKSDARPEALSDDARAFDVFGGHRRQIDVVKQLIGWLMVRGCVNDLLNERATVGQASFERVFEVAIAGAEILRNGNRGDALNCPFDSRTQSAGIQRVFGGVVATVDSRQDQVRGNVAQNVVQPGQNAIGGAAFDRVAARADLLDHERTGVADTVANAGLLKSRGHDPDFAVWTGEIVGNGFQHHQARGRDAVVVCNENAHEGPLCVFLGEPEGTGQPSAPLPGIFLEQERGSWRAGLSLPDLKRCDDARGLFGGVGQIVAVFAGKETGAGGGRHCCGRCDVDGRAGFDRFRLPTAHQRHLGRLGRAIAAKEGLACTRIVKKYGFAVAFEERCQIGDQVGRGGDIGGNGFGHVLGVEHVGGRKRGGMDGRMCPEIECAPAVKNAPAQGLHRLCTGDIHRRQRGGAARSFDAVIKLFERAGCLGDGDDVMGRGKGKRERGAEAA